MTDFERRPTPEAEEPGFDHVFVPFPDEIDDAWCHMVSTVYADGNWRVTVEANRVERERLDADDYHGRDVKHFAQITLPPVVEKPAVAGVVRGLRMRPDWNNPLNGMQYLPYVILGEAWVINGTTDSISQTPEQQVLVPLSTEGSPGLIFFTNPRELSIERTQD